jgi:hypothetical protein
MVEDRREAEEIAAEVRRKGHRVMVREISDLPSLIPTSEERANERGQSTDRRPPNPLADRPPVRSVNPSVRSSGNG